MLKSRWLLSALMIAISGAQALDSHVLGAERFVQWVVALGVLLPGSAFFLTADTRLRVGAVVAAATLMVIARMTSSVRLPELMLTAVFPAVVVIFNHVRRHRVSAHTSS